MSENNEIKEPLNKNFREPKLRFREFKDEWNSIFLKDLVSIHARIGWQGLRQEEFLNEGDYYLITGTDFKNGRINLKEIKYISKFRYEQDKNIQVTNDDILITKDGSIGKVALVKDMNKSATLNAGVYRIRPLKNNVISAYLFQYLSAPFLLNFALKQSSGGTIKHLNQSQIIKFKIPLPSTNEQNKISRFLNLIDNKIETLEAKISTLKKYKEGVFLDTRKCSKKIALKNILSAVNIKTKYNNQYEILSSTAIGLFSQKEYFKHQVASENNVGYKVIKKGQLLFSPQNLWLGNINLNNDFEIGMVSPSYKIYDIDNSINSSWLISMLKSQNMLYKYKQISEQGASVVRRNLDLSQFLEITIDIPDNQIQIGITLETIDKKISALSNLFMNLKKLKMHLLKEMFI